MLTERCQPRYVYAHGGLVRAAILVAAVPCLCIGAPRDGESPAKDFAPGVRIDWNTRTIEVDAHVVLREGALELAACSPRTREHESVLAVDARPMHVFQAMGLIGLEPGKPVHFDEAGDRWLPPTGQRLDLRVRLLRGAESHTVPLDRWLVAADPDRPLPPIDWVFAGSRTFESGRFGADVDGTVICLVDFDTALITVAALHSADNDLLWVHANTKEIPPLDTKCTLLIAAAPPMLAVDVTAEGKLTLDGKEVSPGAIAAGLDQPDSASRAGRRLILRPADGVSRQELERLIDSLVTAGIARDRIETRRIEPPSTRDDPE